VNWLNDEEVNRYLEIDGGYSLKTLKEYLEEVEVKPIYFWAIISKSSKKHIGNIKIDPINTKHSIGEYGILLGIRSLGAKAMRKNQHDWSLIICLLNVI
jgi:hypothetical protein